MTGARYICCEARRRAALAAAPAGISGIDYIEVSAGATTADPTVIEIVLVRPLPLPAAALTGDNIAIHGGIRYAPPQVAPDVEEITGPGGVEGYRVTVPGNQPTDFSTYRLAIVAGPTDPAPPSFIDPRLAAVDFSFKIDCPVDFDCAPCADEEAPAPDRLFDYRVRDYTGFRRQLLDRMTELVPGFAEDDPVDFTTTLIEAAAYAADQLSYRLDWVGTEAFLQTARSRTSLARHARLLDYAIGEGASARLFASFAYEAGTVADGMEVAAGTPLLVTVAGHGSVVRAADYRVLLAHDPIVFETVAALRLWEWRSEIAFYTWSDDECRLPKGALSATLVDGSGGGAGALAAGDFLLLEEVRSPETAEEADARADRRHVVRLTRVDGGVTDPLASSIPLVTVEWAQEDALPFELVIQAPVPGTVAGAPTERCAVARANVTIADHGASFPPAPALALAASDMTALTPLLDPAVPAENEPWRPRVGGGELSRIVPLDLAAAPASSAARLAAVDPHDAEAALVLDDDFGPWTARRDLLRSGRFDRDFVIETGIDGRAGIRFGDGVNGLAPPAGAVLTPRARFGTGLAGNVGADALGHVVLPLAQEAALIRVTNPLPARGGAAPEPASAIRINAPEAFRVQERAVTEADYAAAAMGWPGVANAVAIARWTGAWQTMLIYVDRLGGRALDAAFAAGLLDHLERYRLMGFDIALRAARPAPLDIELMVCVKAGAVRSAVAARLRSVLRPGGSFEGGTGFFHPDRFSFGTPLYASELIAAAMAVEGVESVRLLRFQRFGKLADGEIAAGLIRPNALEILQLSDDPSFPEQGRLALAMGGGR